LQLRQANFKSIVAEPLVTSGLPASLLELEITEGVVLHDLEQTTRTLGELRDLGLSLSIDDFGTGYSSLSYLRDLPIQTIKVDRSFIRDLGSPRTAPHFALALIEAIMSIARALDLDVVAEGIETEAQAITLRGLGCNQGQGYLFARPESPHLITSRLLSQHEGAEQAFLSNLN
jgi:diguanylate cyclase